VAKSTRRWWRIGPTRHIFSTSGIIREIGRGEAAKEDAIRVKPIPKLAARGTIYWRGGRQDRGRRGRAGGEGKAESESSASRPEQVVYWGPGKERPKAVKKKGSAKRKYSFAV